MKPIGSDFRGRLGAQTRKLLHEIVTYLAESRQGDMCAVAAVTRLRETWKTITRPWTDALVASTTHDESLFHEGGGSGVLSMIRTPARAVCCVKASMFYSGSFVIRTICLTSAQWVSRGREGVEEGGKEEGEGGRGREREGERWREGERGEEMRGKERG